MGKPLISIIIPAYNVENYISRCLDSINAQTFKDFEIILIDDGSTDSTYDVIQKSIYPLNISFKIIRQLNQGVSKARNRGIQEAEGEYLCFIDADDMLSLNYLNDFYNIINLSKPDIAVCDSRKINDDENLLILNTKSDWDMICNDKFLYDLLYNNFSTGIWGLCINKKLIIKYNLYFDEGYRYSEDLILVWKCALVSSKIAVTLNKNYLYRIRNNSAMTIVNETRYDGFVLMKRLESFILKYKSSFYEDFKKWGVSRWLLSTIIQSALSVNQYNDFLNLISLYDYDSYIPNLKTHPNKKIRYSSKLFCVNKKFFFVVIKKLGFMRRKVSNE